MWSSGFPVFVRGEGCYVWDSDGGRHLDGLAGLYCSNIGHGRSDLAAVAAKQMETLAFSPTWGAAHPPVIEAAELVAELAPPGLEQVFFVGSGSEAVEAALKLARSFHLANGEPKRVVTIAREWAYHGTTLGSLAATGIPAFREPYLPLLGDFVRHVPNTLGAPLDGSVPASELDCVREIERAVMEAGPETVSCIIAEPVQNGRGALVPPPGYWDELRHLCDRHGILLIADEVINAFGRLGTWFGSTRVGGDPDIITFAKGVTSAYSPLGGLVARRRVMDTIFESSLAGFAHGATFGGHPVSTAVAVANLTALRDEQVLDNVGRLEPRLRSGLDDIADRHDCVGDVRGTGFFYALEFVRSRRDGRPLAADEVAQVLGGGLLLSWIREAKLLIRPDDRGGVMIMVSPPLVADEDVIDDLLGRVDQICDRFQTWIGGRP